MKTIMTMTMTMIIAPIQICPKHFTKAKELKKKGPQDRNTEYNHDKNKINLRFYPATITIFF